MNLIQVFCLHYNRGKTEVLRGDDAIGFFERSLGFRTDSNCLMEHVLLVK